MLGFATELGLDETEFTRCVGSPETAERVLEIRTAGIEQGVQSTPTVIVNGKIMDNPFDVNAIAAEIDRVLAENQ